MNDGSYPDPGTSISEARGFGRKTPIVELLMVRSEPRSGVGVIRARGDYGVRYDRPLGGRIAGTGDDPVSPPIDPNEVLALLDDRFQAVTGVTGVDDVT